MGYHQKDGGVLRVVANVDLKLFPGQVLGLAGESLNGRIGQLDTFLDDVEDILDAYAASQGV